MGGFLASAGAKELLKMLAISAGSDIVAGLGEAIRGETPYEKMMGQQAGYVNQLAPDLFNEARGIPSLATRNLMSQSNQDINRLQQSFQASQQRANPGMTNVSTPQRLGSLKFGQMRQESNRQILGQAQQGARDQLLGLGQNAQTMVGLAEQRRQQRRDEFNQNISGFLGFYQGLNDPVAKSRLDNIMNMLKQLLGGQSLGGAQETVMPSGYMPSTTPFET